MLLLLPLFLACRKNKTPEDFPSMLEFMITRDNNGSLGADILFTVKEDSITASAPDIYNKKLKPSFTTDAGSVQAGGEEQESTVSEQDFTNVVAYTLKSASGMLKRYYAKINWEQDSLPHIYIDTEGGAAIHSKEVYVNATIQVDGKGKYADYTGTTQIRGRGNSTWGMPKKPYRLKLSTKSEMFGLSAEKDWVLLANYLDPTLMLNAVAMKIGQQLELPYTNHIIPVNVTLNGSYIGSYNFTEQVEVEFNRVNVGDEGLLLELDVYYDEDFQFRSQDFNLPVMVKSPDLESQEEIVPIAQQFDALTALLAASSFPDNGYKDQFDIESLAGFLIVHMLTDNQELNHPKSTYMHKSTSGKFTMGPIWDFDWAYGYEGGGTHFVSANRAFFWNGGGIGTHFFERFLSDPEFTSLLKEKWSVYRASSFPELIQFVEHYSVQIRSAKNEDYKKWKTGDTDFMKDVANLRSWLLQRAAYLDGYIQGL